MTLSQLASDLQGARLVGEPAVAIRAVRDDSRAVEPGDLFVAVRGRNTDGHAFVAQAIERGAAAIAVESEIAGVSVPQLLVRSGAIALGELAAAIRGRPGDAMTVIGVTGTNGKTTTTYLMESILAAAGRRPGLIGTVSYRWSGRDRPSPYTTPTPLVLHDTLGQMLADGCTDAVLEVSSAALAMDRLAGLRFQVAMFSNLTQDHLDVHGTMDEYRAAKARLFADHLTGVAVINIDDASGQAMASAAGGRPVLRVSRHAGRGADVWVRSAESTIRGIRATMSTPRGDIEVESSVLLGHYNVDNLALAVAAGEALGIDHAQLARGIASMAGVPGRVDRVRNDAGLDVLVDYAHTPDALTNVLSALEPLAARRLICVFGCGGDRDPSKRPKMGAAVAAIADLAIVTSDNPRTESPQAIIDAILPAVPDPFYVDIDRRAAIRAAIAEATPGDIVVIAGKGHEDYQILGNTKIHFDDREEAAAAIGLRPAFPVDMVVRETGGRLVRRGRAHAFSRVTIDGRSAAPGDLYVAIHGERHDGHVFCGQALDAGAAGILVATGRGRQAAASGDACVIEADDTRAAFGRIARWHRRQWGKPIIGVTGSAGKTTTKDLIAAALGSTGRVHKSAASLNNETGVPLTLLGLRAHHDRAVVEMGMRGLGQIAYLAQLAEPQVGVVVNAGVAHVGVIGSVEAIARGKAEIFARLPAGGAAVYPAGDPRLADHAASAPRRITFGFEESADVRITDLVPLGAAGSRITLRIAGADVALTLPLVGRHNALNAACAMAAVLALGVGPEEAARGLERARPPSLRSEVVDVAGRSVLADCYNANPASMDAALLTLGELAVSGARGVAVIGDMLELGDDADDAHRAVGRKAAELGLAVVAIGDHAGHVSDGATAAGGRATIAADPQVAAQLALAETRPGDWILVKASRKMRLERVIEEMKRHRAESG